MTKKILLADDSITIQKVVRITLADGDYNLITVDNGAEAIDRLKTEMPDLVLADVVMPGKDGYQVCEEIKKNPSLSSIPVILLAGSFEGFDEIKGAEVGADGYIIKPFESQTLISKVEEMLSRPKAKPKKVEEQPVARPAPAAPAPAPQAPAHVDTEVKDFMDTLSAEMDQPKAPEAPAAEPIAAAEPVAEAEPIYGAAEPAAETTAEPIQEAAMVSEEQLWEAEPVEGEAAPGETVMEAEPMSEEALWAEPVAEDAAATGEPVMEAELETTQPGVAGSEVPAEAGIAAEPAIEQPVAEWTPESELPAEPVELGTSGEEPVYGESKIEEAPIAAEPVAREERPDVGAVMEQMPSEEPMPEVGVEAPSAAVHARVAEAAEKIATAATSGLSRSELVELIRATVEKVAWEVVPEMAEALIKERITRWEVQTQ